MLRRQWCPEVESRPRSRKTGGEASEKVDWAGLGLCAVDVEPEGDDKPVNSRGVLLLEGDWEGEGR